MMRFPFSPLPFRGNPFLLAALLLCALGGLCPHAVQAAPSRRREQSAVPRGLVAVPGTTLQIQAPRHAAGRRQGARLMLTFPTRGYAYPAVYRHVRGRWVRIPSRIVRRTRRTTTLVVPLSRLNPRARYAVFAHRCHRRSHGRAMHPL